MTADIRNAASNSRSRHALLLTLLTMFGWAQVIVGAETPQSCDSVVCPKENCTSHFSYRFPCCGKQSICSCFDKQSKTFHELDSIWLSSDCRSSCKCVKKLHMQLFQMKLVVHCTDLRCPVSKAGCKKGLERCCSICKPQPSGCHSPELGRSFKESESWNASPCRTCTCFSGRPVCTIHECGHLSCPPGLQPKALPKECCSTYCRNTTLPIAPYKSCHEKFSNRFFSHAKSYRPQWPCNPLTCTCRHGDWECDSRTAACPTACSENRSVSLGSPGQCCPMCFGTVACPNGKGEYRHAGVVWLDPDKKKQCACIDGVEECLTVPMSTAAISTINPPTPAFGVHSSLPTWIPVVLVILSILLLSFLFASAFMLRKHCDSRFCGFFHFSFDCWPQSPPRENLSMHYEKGADTELMIADENANQRAGEPLA